MDSSGSLPSIRKRDGKPEGFDARRLGQGRIIFVDSRPKREDCDRMFRPHAHRPTPQTRILFVTD